MASPPASFTLTTRSHAYGVEATVMDKKKKAANANGFGWHFLKAVDCLLFSCACPTWGPVLHDGWKAKR